MGKTANMLVSDDRCTLMDLSIIAGNLTEAEKAKLQSGEGFVRVPHEELNRQRVDVYPYLM